MNNYLIFDRIKNLIGSGVVLSTIVIVLYHKPSLKNIENFFKFILQLVADIKFIQFDILFPHIWYIVFFILYTILLIFIQNRIITNINNEKYKLIKSVQFFYNLNLRVLAGSLYLTGIMPHSFWYIVFIPNILYLSSVYIFYPLLDRKVSWTIVFYIFLSGIFASWTFLSILDSFNLSLSFEPDNYILINFAVPYLAVYDSIVELYKERPTLFGPEPIVQRHFTAKVGLALREQNMNNDIYIGHRNYSETNNEVIRYFNRDEPVDVYHQMVRNSNILSRLYYGKIYEEIYRKHPIISQEVTTFTKQVSELERIAEKHGNVSDRSHLGEKISTWQKLAYPDISPLCYTLKITTAIEVGITNDDYYKIHRKNPSMEELLNFHLHETLTKEGLVNAKLRTYKFGLACQKLLQDENLASYYVGNSNNAVWKKIYPSVYLRYIKSQVI